MGWVAAATEKGLHLLGHEDIGTSIAGAPTPDHSANRARIRTADMDVEHAAAARLARCAKPEGAVARVQERETTAFGSGLFRRRREIQRTAVFVLLA
jgi:hypothetical protein